MRRKLLTAACAAMALAAPAPALAARAEVVRTETGEERSHRIFSAIRYEAAPGERNAVTVARTSDGVEIRDDVATIEPGPRCTAIDAHAVRCTHVQEPSGNPIAESVELSLGDQDDTLTGARGIRADGGDGNDALSGGWLLGGGPGDDLLQGTPGSEDLDGGPGRDRLYGGEGADVLNGADAGGEPAADVLDGGAGSDTISYRGRGTPVTVDLADPTMLAGGAGEGDTAMAFENIGGGAGRDTLRGDDGPNHISGGDVNAPIGDRIDGRGGADDLTGTSGGDDIEGGAGDDEIWGVDGPDRLSGGAGDDFFDLMLDEHGPDEIACGAGGDVVDEPHLGHVIRRDCEAITHFSWRVTPVSGGRPGGQTFRIALIRSPNYFPPNCIRIRLGDATGSFGNALFTMPKRGTKYVRVPLTPRGRRKVHPGGRVPFRLNAYLACDRDPPRGRDGFGAFTFVV